MTSWAERHLVNRAVLVGVRLGRDIDGIQELAVVGRRTGKARRTPVKVLEVEGAPDEDVRRGAAGVPVFRLAARDARS
jgi:hypothetical protein